MGYNSILCMACGDDHLYEGMRCILEIGDLVWRRPGAAEPPLLPTNVPAFYYGEGCFVGLQRGAPANVVFYDVDVCEAGHTPEYLLARAFAPEADYIVSVNALGVSACLAASDCCICDVLKRVHPPMTVAEAEAFLMEDESTEEETPMSCAGGGGGG